MTRWTRHQGDSVTRARGTKCGPMSAGSPACLHSHGGAAARFWPALFGVAGAKAVLLYQQRAQIVEIDRSYSWRPEQNPP